MELLLFTVAIGFLAYYAVTTLKQWQRMPPGPWGWPVVGLMFHLLHHDILVAFAEYKKKYGKIFSVKIGDHNVVVINDHKMLTEAMKMNEFAARPLFDNTKIRNHGKMNRGISFSEGSIWQEQRRFAFRNLRDFGFGKESMEGMLQHELTGLISYLKKQLNTPMYLDNVFNASTLNSLWYILTGKHFELGDPRLIELTTLISRSVRGARLATPMFFLPWAVKYNLIGKGAWNNTAKMRSELQAFIKEEINEHVKTYDPSIMRDYMDVYIKNIKESSEDSSFHGEEGYINLMLSMQDVFVGGAETTATTTSWTILYLTQNPQVLKKAQNELDTIIGDRQPTREDKSRYKMCFDSAARLVYLDALLSEVHRMASIAPFTVYHRTTQDIEFGGYFIPKDTVVIPNIYDAHYDPEYWKDPETFRPERFLDSTGTKLIKHDALMPFAPGKRTCPGETLARDTLYFFVAGLLQTFNFEIDPACENVDLGADPAFVRAPRPFKVIISLRNK